MIDVYSWATGNARKIYIMLEETGLDDRGHPGNISIGDQCKSIPSAGDKASGFSRWTIIADPDTIKKITPGIAKKIKKTVLGKVTISEKEVEGLLWDFQMAW